MKQSDIDAITTPGMHLIERGLYLQVRGPTARSWVLRYRFGGQQRDLGLGSAFDVSLVKARDLRDHARTLMRQGSLTPSYGTFSLARYRPHVRCAIRESRSQYRN
jgi:hypothetical protein